MLIEHVCIPEIGAVIKRSLMSDENYCRAEAGALLEQPVSAAEAASQLGSLCSLAAITDGANGSCISALGHLKVCCQLCCSLCLQYMLKVDPFLHM